MKIEKAIKTICNALEKNDRALFTIYINDIENLLESKYGIKKHTCLNPAYDILRLLFYNRRIL